MKWIFGLLLAGLAASSWAQSVYKCRDAKGQPVYQSEPCPEAEKRWDTQPSTTTWDDYYKRQAADRKIAADRRHMRARARDISPGGPDSGPLSPLPMQTLVLTLSAHAIKLTKLWASAGPSRHLAIGTISFGTLASESSARTELPSADGMNKRKARSSRRDQARIGESNSALGKEPWYKCTWVIAFDHGVRFGASYWPMARRCCKQSRASFPIRCERLSLRSRVGSMRTPSGRVAGLPVRRHMQTSAICSFQISICSSLSGLARKYRRHNCNFCDLQCCPFQ